MTHRPVTLRPDSDPLAGVAICKSGKLRHLPVVGAEDRIEIWKEENWHAYFDAQMSRYEEIAERTVSRINGFGREAEDEQ